MLRLRPYKACDAEKIVSWTKDERAFRQWSADRFDRYPFTGDDLNQAQVMKTIAGGEAS